MTNYLRVLYDGITEISPDEILGALVIGMVLALACSGLCLLVRKRVTDPLPPLCALIFLVCAGSMAFGVGHARYKLVGGARSAGPVNTSPQYLAERRSVRGVRQIPYPHGHHLIREADADHNNQLTPEEAAEFVRKADSTGKGWVDVVEIDRALNGLPPSPPPTQGPPKVEQDRSGL